MHCFFRPILYKTNHEVLYKERTDIVPHMPMNYSAKKALVTLKDRSLICETFYRRDIISLGWRERSCGVVSRRIRLLGPAGTYMDDMQRVKVYEHGAKHTTTCFRLKKTNDYTWERYYYGVYYTSQLSATTNWMTIIRIFKDLLFCLTTSNSINRNNLVFL